MTAARASLGALLDGLTPAGDGALTVTPDADWRQGRTLYGGLTTALCAETARRAVDALPRLRSVQVAFIGPAAGELRLTPTLLRRGRSAAFIAVDAAGTDGICARSTLAYGAARDSPVHQLDADAPAVPGPDECPALPASDIAPAFLAQFDVRRAGGGIPFGGGDPRLTMWVRFRDASGARAADPAIALLAVCDVLPPAASPLFGPVRGMSSMTWSLEVLELPAQTEWYLLRSLAAQTADGYSVQMMGCWDRSGRCLALSHQTVAIF